MRCPIDAEPSRHEHHVGCRHFVEAHLDLAAPAHTDDLADFCADADDRGVAQTGGPQLSEGE